MTTKLVRCSLCGCKEYYQRPNGDYHCSECERDLGEPTDRMLATERVLEAAFNRIEERKEIEPCDVCSHTFCDLIRSVKAHPDFKVK